MNLPDIFYFTLRLPYLEIHTEVMVKHCESMSFIYYEIFVQVYKWKFHFSIGNSERRRKKAKEKRK